MKNRLQMLCVVLILTGMSQASGQKKLESQSAYDFIPGDEILYFEDFSQDAIGEFPRDWSGNGSGEVKIVNIASGHWFHMNGEDAAYCCIRALPFPSDFILEFDIIPDAEYSEGIVLTLYEEQDYNELSDDIYPGLRGLHIIPGPGQWQTVGYSTESDHFLEGIGSRGLVRRETVNHVIVWVQNRRVRIYSGGDKVVDMATNIYAGTQFSRLRFSGWDRGSTPLISNIKITTAAPDMRSKLVTEGRLIAYGIYFDSGEDVIKPESYGTLKDIAAILTDVTELRIRIVGHTDNDGDDAMNLKLSEKRAESVKRYLSEHYQIASDRLETEGKGETEPIARNSGAENKAKNRRVELLKL